MRLLVPGSTGIPPLRELDDATVFAAYAPPRASWLRSNMVSTLDGSVTGADERSGSINNAADRLVFEALRAWSHAVVVGAGTLRAERYTPIAVDDTWRALRAAQGLPPALPIVAVSNSGELPPRLEGVRDGSVLLATHRSAPGLKQSAGSIGDDNVIVCGSDAVDLGELVQALHDRGWTRLLTEGGPSLLSALLREGLLDELCLTIVPALVGGHHPRPVGGQDVPTDLHLELLAEQDGTLLGRWLTGR
ncbi:pyrimidine reductase family protein [Intrasporangium mesophilum]